MKPVRSEELHPAETSDLIIAHGCLKTSGWGGFLDAGKVLNLIAQLHQ